MHILADKTMIEVLKTKFSTLTDLEFYMVQLEQETDNSNRQDVCGLDQAIEVAKTGLPVVMLGWMPTHMYVERTADKWFAANGYPNVGFALPFATPEEVYALVTELETKKRPSDSLAIALYGLAQTNSALGVLHHDISSAKRNAERMALWEEKARAIFGDKTQDELLALVAEAAQARNSPGKFAGQEFPDVCIDVEGTILTADDQIRSEVIKLAEEKAKGGPITVWTGGNIGPLSAQLRKAGVLYKIVSKETMRGATVRVVIDDQTEATFKRDYGIDFGEYLQV